MESDCIDYGKNLPIPNFTINDVHCKGQLSMYLFSIIAQKISGKKFLVVFLLSDFLSNHLKSSSSNVNIFWDSCVGQNKKQRPRENRKWSLSLCPALVMKVIYNESEIFFSYIMHSFQEYSKYLRENVTPSMP